MNRIDRRPGTNGLPQTMHVRFYWGLLLVLLLCRTGNADSRVAVSAKSNTFGFGGEVTFKALDSFNCRVGATGFAFSFDGTINDIDYGFDVKTLAPSILVDWYPFKGSFHVSAGAFFNESELGLTATPSESIQIGGTTYTPADIGRLSGKVDFAPVAPYIGIGWGNAFGKEKRWGFVSDMGVAFIGSPNVDLSATGAVAGDPTFLANLAEEERDIEDTVDIFRFLPMFSFSIFFRF